MPKQKQKLTENQKEYKRIEKKLKRKIRELGKRGYTFGEIPTPKKITKKVIEKLESITQDIYEYAKYYDPLQNKYITGKERQKQERAIAARKGWETRRRKEALEYYEQHRNEGSFREIVDSRRDLQSVPFEEESIFDTVYQMIEQWSPDPLWSPELAWIKREDTSLLKSTIDGALLQLGRETVLRNLKRKAYRFQTLAQEIMFMSGSKFHDSGRNGLQARINELTEIVWGRALTVEESEAITTIAESLNELEE